MMNAFRAAASARAAILPALLVALLLTAGSPVRAADAGTGDTSRAAWLLDRMNDGDPAGLAGIDLQRDEFSRNATPNLAKDEEETATGRKSPLLILASAIVPGSGEILMGNWVRGSALVLADAFCWYKAKDASDEGKRIEDEYYAFADAHWSEQNLYYGYSDTEGPLYLRGVGLDYFDLNDEDGNPISAMSSIDDLVYLSLWVSKEDDRREYYENLGKWDQFVFGWDDFRNPNDPPAGVTYTPDQTLNDLRQPWTSYNRTIYRDLREKSNDAFQRRDRYLYVNLGLRVFSLLEVAYLQGWLGGDAKDSLAVAGHEVHIVATPGLRGQGTLAAQFSF